MGPYRDSISLKKSPLLGLYTGSEAQLDLATVRYHALGAYAKSVYLVSKVYGREGKKHIATLHSKNRPSLICGGC